jgi:glycyl-tRNA synthetase beta chain
MEATLLVELLTEELPPRSLARLSAAFAETLAGDLRLQGFLGERSEVAAFATPRRLAVSISQVKDVAPDAEVLVKGPSVKAGLDAAGNPAPALIGFAKKRGVPVEQLVRINDGKQEVFAHRDLAKGGHLGASLAAKVENALKKLPVAKLMRWGAGEAEFVRPVHGLVMLHGADLVPGAVLGLVAGNRTRGHRFLGQGEIALKGADSYAPQLLEEGRVIADFAGRRAEIERLLKVDAARLHASLGVYQDLLEEVTALVEYPAVYVGEFDPEYLEVPAECLVLTMRQNQKYFPLFDEKGALLPRFLIVSNMRIADPRGIIDGNQRVVRPRLDDARFFYRMDRKVRLEARVPQLAGVVYHNKLGSQLDRVQRIQLLAGKIARALGADPAAPERAAWLAKADLLTAMVGEFPELQGIMGRYYALHDGEPQSVADAIEAHYRPRFAGDAIPADATGAAVALADKLYVLCGLFGIGQQPTGDRDPFALRRQALGVVRILVEGGLSLPLDGLVNDTFSVFPPGMLGTAQADVQMFILERLRGYLRDTGYSANEVEAVLCKNPVRFDVIPRQLAAVRAFASLPEAQSLAAANKRIANVLRQAAAKGESFKDAKADALREPAERALFAALSGASQQAAPLFAAGDYTGYLKAFAVLKSPVDAFFDSVMVMADDAVVRHNRLALLEDLRREMNRFADISKLAA